MAVRMTFLQVSMVDGTHDSLSVGGWEFGWVFGGCYQYTLDRIVYSQSINAILGDVKYMVLTIKTMK